MLKPWLLGLVKSALLKAKVALGPLSDWPDADIEAQLFPALRLERPRQASHGDFAVNVSFLAKQTKLPPPVIAQTLLEHLPSHPSTYSCNVVAGFLNFQLSEETLCQSLLGLLNAPSPGQNQSLAQTRLLLEYVSANPTGPLHLGHGRWAALGDSMARIAKHCGATVTTEFYVNDFGQQMGHMANSLWFRSLEQLKLAAWPDPAPYEARGEKFPYYPGEYVITLAQQFLADLENKAFVEALFAQVGPNRVEEEGALNRLKLYCRDAMLTLQKDLLARFGCPFDNWVMESSLHESGEVAATLKTLQASGFVAELDGALWLKSSALGDEKDRVLVKSDGSYTYLTADIAYHHDKFTRKTADGQTAYNQFVDVWGADHHGYIARIKAALQALGHPTEQFEVVLGQLVNLVVDGAKARMGKRKQMLTLEDVLDEVGVDATRFWLVSRSADHTIEFDVDLAASTSDENPVFYTQYAHARACSIIRNAFDPALYSDDQAKAAKTAGLERPTFEALPTTLTPQTYAQWLFAPLKTNDNTADLTPALTPVQAEANERAQTALRELILLLDSFEERVADAGRLHAPNLLARTALDVSAQFHSFYGACRVLSGVSEQTYARLGVVWAVQRVLSTCLGLLGVSAPERM